jgi:arylsulfatase A-like enzyme
MQQNLVERMSFSYDAFKFSLKWWLFVFVTVLLPLDLLYQCGALSITLPWYRIAIAFATLVAYFSLMAIFVASVSMIVSLLLQMFTIHGVSIVKAVNGILGLFVILITFGRYLFEWQKKVFYIGSFSSYFPYKIFAVMIVILLSIIITFYLKTSLDKDIAEISAFWYKVNISIVLMSFLIVIGVISNNRYIHIGGENVSHLQQIKVPSSSPNIIIITFDALNVQHCSLYGFKLNTTPELVKLGETSYVFDNMYSSGNWTLPGLSSIYTGKHQVNHGMLNRYSAFHGVSQYENLPYVLKQAGYETALSMANRNGIPWRIKLRGFDHVYSFEEDYLDEFLSKSGIIAATTWKKDLISQSFLKKMCSWLTKWSRVLDYVHPEESFKKARELLSMVHQPFFLYVHIVPPHSPYLPRKDFMYTFLPDKIFDNQEYLFQIRRFCKGTTYRLVDQPKIDKLALRYDEHILYGDHEVGEFISYLKEIGVYDKSIVIVSSDHGEIFERGFWSHGGPYLYQGLIHVPLIIHLPGQTQGKRIDANVSHADLAPTILDLLGIEPPSWMDGKSFKKALDDSHFDTGTKFAMNLYEMNRTPKFGTTSIAAIYGDYKLIKYLKFNQYEMFNLKKDPGEQKNLVKQEPEIFNTLNKEIEEVLSHRTLN